MTEYKHISVVIAAGGSGSRFGGEVPKQFLVLEGEPVVIRAISPFIAEENLKSVAVVVPKDWMDWMKSQIKERGWSKMVKVVQGGSHRGESVYAGLKAVKDSDVVHIHDSVRPFVHHDMIVEASKKAWEYGGAVIAVPVRDTLKKEAEGLIAGTVNRENLWRVQTPQTFRTKIILKAYKIASKLGFKGTDDSVLLERFTGIRVKLVEGSERNIKITTSEDFKLAESIIKAGEYT